MACSAWRRPLLSGAWRRPPMALRVQTFRKEFLAARVRDLVADRALVAVAHAGNMGNVDKALVKATLSEAGAKVNYTRNKYAAKALEAAGLGELSPLLRGMTAIIAGPSEVETAKALHGLSKQLPDFFVLGAMLDSQRILQAESALG